VLNRAQGCNILAIVFAAVADRASPAERMGPVLGGSAMYCMRGPVAILLCAVACAAASAAPPDDLARSIDLQAKLAKIREFPALDDPKMTLQEAIDFVSKHCDVTIQVNERAFQAEGVKDVLTTPIAEIPIPEFRNTLSLMIRKLLERLPKGDPVFIIRGGTLEITTRKAFIREFYRLPANEASPQPLVHASIVNAPLTTALRDLARSTSGNIVLDVRAAKEAQTTVTADFTNVPLDTAVKLLADMCNLASVEVGNVLYVTSKDNGRALQREQEERRLRGHETPGATK
jgi:hypothetical protein